MEWRGTAASFCAWFIGEIETLLRKKSMVKIRGRERLLTWEDFGYSSRSLRPWKDNAPADIPEGKKLRDIVDSVGFGEFEIHAKRQVILAWIGRGLEAQARPSENLVHLLKLLAENTADDFLVNAAREAFRFHLSAD